MWQAISRPDVLIFLDASDEETRRRGERHYIANYNDVERSRLEHARVHCDLYILTDALTPEEVLAQASAYLTTRPTIASNQMIMSPKGDGSIK
jgi:hypothetical protein